MNVIKSGSPKTAHRREKARLGSELERSLSAYVCAGIAAGVNLLAMAAPSEAEVVYTPANTQIPVNNHGYVALDLNHDGIVDFAFWNLHSTYRTSGGDRSTHVSRLNLYVGCAPIRISCRYSGNEIWGVGVANARRLASPLPAGISVGPSKSHFQQFPQGQGYVLDPVALMGKLNLYYDYADSFSGSSASGSWLNSPNRYLGLQFVIGGEIHYGWARLSVAIERFGGTQAVITGYAYETTPGKPIKTGATSAPPLGMPEPASLGHLARGASDIAAWRKAN
jgi:hypothetical protein